MTFRTNQQHGISLVELLVGMAIGLMTILVITQVFLFSEEQRRIPTTGANTQINGILALDALQRDIRHAGYGLADANLLACTVATSEGSTELGLAGVRVSPVMIQAGATAKDSDSITVLSSNKVDASFPIQTAQTHATASTEFVIRSAPTAAVGDWMIIAPLAGNTCSVFQVIKVTNNGDTSTLSHGPNTGLGTVAAKSTMVNLGVAPYYRSWSINNRLQLQVANPAEGTASDAYSEIALMRAFYAKDTNGDGSVDTYDTVVPTTAAQWAQVLGVRVAIVARSPQQDKAEVTTAPLQWDLGDIAATNSKACTGNSNSQCLELDLSGTSNDWKLYRYRMFDTMIPIRNLLWSNNL